LRRKLSRRGTRRLFRGEKEDKKELGGVQKGAGKQGKRSKTSR